jgi:hypothetical protein
MSGAIPPLPQYAFMASCFVKAQGQLYLYLISAIKQNDAYNFFSVHKEFLPPLGTFLLVCGSLNAALFFPQGLLLSVSMYRNHGSMTDAFTSNSKCLIYLLTLLKFLARGCIQKFPD